MCVCFFKKEARGDRGHLAVGRDPVPLEHVVGRDEWALRQPEEEERERCYAPRRCGWQREKDEGCADVDGLQHPLAAPTSRRRECHFAALCLSIPIGTPKEGEDGGAAEIQSRRWLDEPPMAQET